MAAAAQVPATVSDSTSYRNGGTKTPKFISKPQTYFSYGPLDHAVAGLGGGFASTMILHPLDLIKTRFQVQDTPLAKHVPRERYRNTPHALSTIVKTEGLRGLYQGLTPNLLGNVTAWGSYFLGYNAAKSFISEKTGQAKLGPLYHMGAAAMAGVFTQIWTNPIWVVKTRMCFQDPSAPGAYRNIFDAFGSIWRQEGLAGLYKGFVPGLFGVSHGAVQFMAYEELKHVLRQYKTEGQDPDQHSTVEYIGMASVSKVVAAATTYPYQVLRSRLQNQRAGYEIYTGVVDCIRKTWGSEGVRGFYHGLGPSILRVLPATCITFVAYENITYALRMAAIRREESRSSQ